MKQILACFGVESKELTIDPMGGGLINDTFKVSSGLPSGNEYVLQRINNNIFKEDRKSVV